LIGTIGAGVIGYFGYTASIRVGRFTAEHENMQKIAIGFHYQASATDDSLRAPYLVDESGTIQSGSSWRVGLLPYIEQDHLYRQYNKKEPWDSAANKSVSNTPIKVYTTPYGKEKTTTNTPYRVFYGGGALFSENNTPAASLKWIPDGTSNTILLVQAWEQVPWAAPRDLKYDPKAPLPKLGHQSLGGLPRGDVGRRRAVREQQGFRKHAPCVDYESRQRENPVRLG
jgi:hypothetical protein